MAVIAFPALPIRSIEWELDRPAQINSSQWTGTDQVDPKTWLGRWSCTAELVPIAGEAGIRAWRSFVAGMKGSVNTTRLIAVEAAQHDFAYGQPSAATAAAGATSLGYTGWVAGTTALLDGHMITVNEQLLILRADATTDGSGAGTFTFEPPLRKAVVAGTQINTRFPYALVAFTESRQGWSAGPGRIYGAGFSAKERP